MSKKSFTSSMVSCPGKKCNNLYDSKKYKMCYTCQNKETPFVQVHCLCKNMKLDSKYTHCNSCFAKNIIKCKVEGCENKIDKTKYSICYQCRKKSGEEQGSPCTCSKLSQDSKYKECYSCFQKKTSPCPTKGCKNKYNKEKYNSCFNCENKRWIKSNFNKYERSMFKDNEHELSLIEDSE